VKNKKGKPPLSQHISSKPKANDDSKNNQEKKQKKPYCKQCKMKGHVAKDCDKWDEEPCEHCGRFNHKSKDCWHKDKPKQDKGKGNANLHK
jgi:hypothetical protein